jgi:hypothetical protein
MSKEILHYNLYNYCSLNNFDKAKSVLTKDLGNIDVMYKNGALFEFSIIKNSTEMLKALLTYFEEKQFPIKNSEYQEAREKLIKILENSISVELSLEMKKILSPYIDFEDSEHNTLNDSFSDIDQTTFIENFNKNVTSNNLLNEEVLKKFEAEQNSQTKIIENLLGFFPTKCVNF